MSMSKKSEPVVVESVNSVDNSVEVLQAKIAAMRKAQEKFASYTQEQVDRIFFESAMAANNIVVPNERTSGSVRVNISQVTEKGRKMENRGQR